jgi:hypothetical protein|uniref:Uncharacterized protein n=1 Tax=viral metagenome TaxID=1070528 RepID=A0A6C0J020_9ZZZZ
MSSDEINSDQKGLMARLEKIRASYASKTATNPPESLPGDTSNVRSILKPRALQQRNVPQANAVADETRNAKSSANDTENKASANPQNVPRLRPDVLRRNVPQNVSRNVPQNVPQNVSQNVSQNDVLRMRQQFERGNYSQDSSGSGRIIAFACLGFVFASFCANMFYIKNPPECAEDSDDEDEQEKKKKCKKDRFERTVTAGIVGAVFGVILYFVNGS